MQEKKKYKEVKEIGASNYANEYWDNYFNSAPEGVKKYLRFKWDVYENNESTKNLKKLQEIERNLSRIDYMYLICHRSIYLEGIKWTQLYREKFNEEPPRSKYEKTISIDEYIKAVCAEFFMLDYVKRHIKEAQEFINNNLQFLSNWQNDNYTPERTAWSYCDAFIRHNTSKSEVKNNNK